MKLGNKTKKILYTCLTITVPVVLIAVLVVSWLVLFPVFFYKAQPAATATDAEENVVSDEELVSRNQALMDEEELSQSEMLQNNLENYTGKSVQIYVLPSQNLTVVYGLDSDGAYTLPLSVMSCSVGTKIEPGTYTLDEKYTWINKKFVVDGAWTTMWNHYCQTFGEDYVIASAHYWEADVGTLYGAGYNLIGKSHNGQRIILNDYDARTLFNLCDTRTTIIVAEADATVDFTVPSVRAIGKECYWDPTNNSEANPWATAAPGTIAVTASNITLERGDDINYYQYIVALNRANVAVNNKVEIEGEVDTDVPGEYPVTYRMTLGDGSTPSATITFTVKDTEGPEIEYPLNVNVVCAEKAVTQKNTRTKIVEYLKKNISITDNGEKIKQGNADLQISFVVKDKLQEGYQRYEITAEDAYGNVTTVIGRLYIKVEEDAELTISASSELIEEPETTTEEETTTKKTETKTTKKDSETKTTKKPVETTTTKPTETTTKKPPETKTTEVETTTPKPTAPETPPTTPQEEPTAEDPTEVMTPQETAEIAGDEIPENEPGPNMTR